MVYVPYEKMSFVVVKTNNKPGKIIIKIQLVVKFVLEHGTVEYNEFIDGPDIRSFTNFIHVMIVLRRVH